MLGFLPTRAYRPGTPGATTFLSPLSGTFNYGWDSFFRGIAGLESIDPEVLQAGVGGPGLGSDPVDPSHRGLEEQLVTTRPSRLGTLPQGRDGRRVAPPADSMASSFYYTRSRGGA